MAWRLSEIQQTLFTYRAHVFMPVANNDPDMSTTTTFRKITVNADGSPNPVPCFRDEKSNVYDSLEVGRTEGESRRDFDEWFFPEGFILNDGYYIKDITPSSPSTGYYWICRGAPSVIPKDPNGIRDAGQTNIQSSIVWGNEIPPDVLNG